MHPVAFHSGFVETVLFKEWNTSNWQGILGSAIAIVVLAALYEALKYYRLSLHSKIVLACKQSDPTKEKKITIFTTSHLLQTILYSIQFVISNLLMLIFMTYNIYICVSIILGAAIGYFLLYWKREGVNVKITNEKA